MEITDDYYILYIENDMLQMQQKTDFVIMHSAGCFLQEKTRPVQNNRNCGRVQGGITIL